MTSVRPDPRLKPSLTEAIDRSKTVVFNFDGRSVDAFEGDTIASALYASGVRTFSRSFKYHRPRGLLCAGGNCPNCLMTVDGVPNVRACTEKVRRGMSVRGQNAWPSVDRDFLSVLDKLGKLMPVGFYYKTFHRPKLFWQVAQPVIRRVAGIGPLETDAPPGDRYTHRNAHTDVAVVGGGPAGLSAALAAAEAGAAVTLIDDQTDLGGHLRWDNRVHRGLPDIPEATGSEIGRSLAAAVRATGAIDVLSEATAFGLYQDNLLGVLAGDEFVKLRAKRVVVATGSYDVPLVFERNDLPGVMLTSAALRLIHLYGVRPGSTAVIATNDDEGYHAALDLQDAGARIAVLVDSRPEFPHGMEAAEALRAGGTLILPSHTVVLAEGNQRVVEAIVARVADGRPTAEERRFDCDIICMSAGAQPAGSLLQMSGAEMSYDPALGKLVPGQLPADVYTAGDVTGTCGLAESVMQGRHAGAQAAAGEAAGHVVSAREPTDLAATSVAPPEAGHRRFICVCEDITESDVVQAIDEGFDDIQTLKRYSTVTMGPCQGKMCHKAFVESAARQTGRSLVEIGATTSRPPVRPVPLGALAGPSHMPIKRTPLHQKHEELGAEIVDLGPWRRPYSYTSPQDECLAVRERVGIIDVSTLGKLDVRGRDAPALLDKVYTHRFSDLRVGRIRYGILCSDDGTIMDDGTVGRLADDRYFVTTTTGNIELIEEWFKWWTAGTGMCVHYTNATSDYAAINVAGPRARETLAKLTDVDLSPKGFRYMRLKQSEVAGVPALLLRIGFVGETGWELHFPSEYGEYMWDALMEAGREFGIAPFGLEAQRILRLEKKHVIVGQDTDAVSNPLESDMGWVVKFDKEDFIGRGGLVKVRERGEENKLVGFIMGDNTVPDDGDPVMADGRPVGRVTSARLSPTAGKGFGLMWVPIDLAEDGTPIGVRVDGKDLTAHVRLDPVYDPEGKRLRE